MAGLGTVLCKDAQVQWSESIGSNCGFWGEADASFPTHSPAPRVLEVEHSGVRLRVP